MIDRSHELPVIRQCQVLGIARLTAYDTPEPLSPGNLALIELHLENPFTSSRDVARPGAPGWALHRSQASADAHEEDGH
jgi:hypothetical protein